MSKKPTKTSPVAPCTTPGELDPRSMPRGYAFLRIFVRFIDVSVNIYSLVSFAATSSLLDVVLMREAVFLDDVANGLFDFTPATSRDQIILDALHTAKPGQCRSIGFMEGKEAMPTGGKTASYCHRINVDLGYEAHVMYYGDGISRRYLRKIETQLPPTCVGWTVAAGAPYTATPIRAVQEARQAYGDSYLRCTDPRIFTSNSYADATNVTTVRFRAGAIVAQKHFAGAQFGLETHQSYCKAEKLGDSDVYKVSPFTDGDTRMYVTVLFSHKGWLNYVLDYGGQAIVLIVLIQEIVRAVTMSLVSIPTAPFSFYTYGVRTLLGQDLGMAPPANGGAATLQLSQIWLANPWYLIGNSMYALGSSIETQMIVEILFWQYQKSWGMDKLLLSGVYAMRHAWISVMVWTSIRLLVKFLPVKVRQYVAPVRALECYCSSRAAVLAFILASIFTVFTRNVLYLTQFQEYPDVLLGIPMTSMWQSEVFQSLAVNHGAGIFLGTAFALVTWAVLAKTYPGHRDNSLVRIIDQHRLCAGFDLAQLFSTGCAFTHQGRCVLLLPLADIYLIYSSVNLLSSTAMAGIENIKPGHAITMTTTKNGALCTLHDSGMYIPQLVALQANSPPDVIYCAIV